MPKLKFITNAAARLRARPRRTIAVVISLAVVAIAGRLYFSHRADSSRAAALATPLAARTALSGPPTRPTRVIAFSEGCMTSECHTELEKLPEVHAPILSRACDACHAPDIGGHRYPLLRAKSQLCSSCHDTGAQHPVQHQAMTDDGCLACHRPHSGETRKLLIKPTEKETCAQCHPPNEGIARHAPYANDRCDLCHDPHGSNTKGLLRTKSIAESCRVCHPATVEATETALHSHRSVERSCLACHSPHAAPVKGLLAAASRETCITCHPEIGKTVANSTVSHDPVLKGEQCVRCHDPHASEHPGMLRAAQAEVCLSCHNKALTAADGRTIPLMTPPPAETLSLPGHNQCSGCHSVHGGTHTRLLRETNDKLPLGPFDSRNYALCFSCHDARLASVAASTQFRDGSRNLHEIHLKPGDHSRGCAACHAVHAAGEPRLIAKSVNFEGSGWMMPIRFTLTPDGGKCASSCHEPLEYSRKPGGARPALNGGAP